MNTCGLILLAAGASNRMGQAKQLLSYNNTSFLLNSVNIALQSSAYPIVIVYGANPALIEPQLNNVEAHIVYNPCWEKGISSSINAGLSALLQLHPAISRTIFMVCDQPFVNAGLLNDMIEVHMLTGKKIVASNYGDVTGTPTLFSKDFFNELLELKGDEGAKKIIRMHPDEMSAISFPMGRIDIDTREDYELLSVLNSYNKKMDGKIKQKL